MANRFGRTQRKTGKMAARTRRLTILPKADKFWLLAGTAIITGAVMWPTHPALAVCSLAGDDLDCVGTETTPQTINGIDGFSAEIGAEGPDVNGSIAIPNAVPGSALAIDGNGFSGFVDVYDGSFIQTLNPGGAALSITDFGSVDVEVHGVDALSPLDAAGYIFGTANGISAVDGGEFNLDNSGEVVGASQDGVFAQTIGSGGVEIDNYSFSAGEDVFGGGLIAGGVNGVNVDNVLDFGDVFIDNAGYWTEDPVLSDGDVTHAFRDGGLIFGETGAGIQITSFEDNVFIENSNTLASDASPFTNIGDLVMPTIDGPTGPTAVTAGIWGGEYGIFIDGETGSFEDGRFVGIRNFNGLIVGEHNDGIHIQNMGTEDPFEDAVEIYNGNGGIITGSETGSGINGSEIDGFVYINNGGVPAGFAAFEDNLFGPAFAGEDSPAIPGGFIVGDADGIELHGVEDGVWIDNALGEIWGTGFSGSGGTGIEITDVTRDVSGEDGYVGIASGFPTGSPENMWIGESYLNPFNPITDGGFIYGNGRAITVAPSEFGLGEDYGAVQAGVFNGMGGFILGEGFVDFENPDPTASTPVIFLHTSNEGFLGEDTIDLPLGGEDTVSWNQASIQIVNYGLMSSYHLPHLQIGDFADIGPGEVPTYSFDDDAFRDDVSGLQDYVWNGGSASQLDGFLTPETAIGDAATDYQTAASALLMTNVIPTLLGSEDISGVADIYNFDAMFGRVLVAGFNEDFLVGEDSPGNLIHNEGLWVVRDDTSLPDQFGFAAALEDVAGGEDIIVNNGHIQTALDSAEDERATFIADVFVQGSSYLKYQEIYQLGEDGEIPLPEITPKTGLLSMIDGAEGDLVSIGEDFIGAEDFAFGQFGNEDASQGFKSYVAMDVFLRDEEDYTGTHSHASDLLEIGEDAGGTTGLIFRKTNGSPIGIDSDVDDTTPEILVVDVDGFTFGEDCSGGENDWCKAGDTFFIAPQSDGYFEAAEGPGFISDGLKSWGLVQGDEVGEDGEDYYLVAAEDMGSPGGYNAPKVASGVLNIADEIFDVVYDHSYGFQFRPGGGGGADLPIEAPVYEAPVESGTQTGLWAKVTGSQIDREDDLTENGLTFETDYDQDIYTILGGADFKWDPNSPLRLGLFGGYINSSMDFSLGDGEVDYEGGVVGGYVAYNDGAFYADATLKGEFLNNDYSFDSIDASADSTSIGVSANTGYRFSMGSSFVEPLASLRYVHASIDDADTSDGTIEYSDPDSLKAGAGARIGTAFGTGGATTELSLLGRVWNEFDGETEVTVDNGIDVLTYSDDMSGVYGEVEGQILVTSSDGTLSGFVSANSKFGDDFTSYGAKAGVRKGF